MNYLAKPSKKRSLISATFESLPFQISNVTNKPKRTHLVLERYLTPLLPPINKSISLLLIHKLHLASDCTQESEKCSIQLYVKRASRHSAFSYADRRHPWVLYTKNMGERTMIGMISIAMMTLIENQHCEIVKIESITLSNTSQQIA